jgi:hypothetical protein
MATLEQQFIENINKNKLIIPEWEIDCEREFNYYLEHEKLVAYFDTEEKVRNFLDNPTIQMLMVHNHVDKIEVDEVKDAGIYPTDEDDIGNPKSNGNLIHHAYSLNQFLKQIHPAIVSIFEFGGGYGSLIRLFARLRTKGPFYSYDLPFFSELQKYFLGRLNIGNTYFYSNKMPAVYVDLFVGLWSFSEASIAVREEILQSVTFKNCLIAYQPECNGINNIEYFEKLKSRIVMEEWFDYEVPHLKSRYLIGIHES